MERIYHISNDITLIKGKLTPHQVSASVDILKDNEKWISPYFCALYSPHVSLDERVEGFFRHNQQEGNQTHTYLICSKNAQKIVGAFTVGLSHTVAEIYYWLDKSQSGKGIMSQTLAYMRDRLFLDEKLEYCYAVVDKKNKRSRALLKKSGFCFEKTPDENMLYCSMTRDQYRWFVVNQKLNHFRSDKDR